MTKIEKLPEGFTEYLLQEVKYRRLMDQDIELKIWQSLPKKTKENKHSKLFESLLGKV